MHTYLISYDTKVSKNVLWAVINASTFEKAFDSFCELIKECETVTFVQKMF